MEQEEKFAAQIRAGRGLLKWSQQQLADAAGVSSMTVKRAEGSGSPRPGSETLGVLTSALEAAGVQFIEENGGGPGVRLRK